MLRAGQQRAFQGAKLTRRELLQAGSLGVLGLTLADLLRMEALAGSGQRPARSIILLWLWGGPSHLDTFDMKPHAPLEYRGPYVPISTNVPGIEVCELLPRLAQRADKYCLIRSMHCNSNDHGIAGTIGLTGSDTGAISLSGQVMPGQVLPTHGSVVSRVLGFRPEMPTFVTIGTHLQQGKRRITGEGGGGLGALYDPFWMDYQPSEGIQLPQLELLDGHTPDGLSARRELLSALDRLARHVDNWKQLDGLDQYYQQAYALLTSPQARRVFDLEAEPEGLRDQYGRFRFGQCCLLARRLVEAGARFVQVNWSSHVESIEDTGDGGWDLHDRNFQVMQDRHAWMLDQALATLLDDLQARGLLDETVVIAVGEFGRTPKINNKSGRDHWHDCYSALVAGGGLPGGQVIGASDRRAEYPVQRPVTPADLFRTALARLGIGTTELTSVGITPLGEPLEELL